MPKNTKRGGGSSSNGSETRWGPVVTTRSRRHRADTVEQASRSVSTNPIPGSAGTPPGVEVAALTLEQLMEAVGAHVRDEMQAMSSTPYQPPQIQPATPNQPPATPYPPPSTPHRPSTSHFNCPRVVVVRLGYWVARVCGSSGLPLPCFIVGYV